MTKSDVFLFVQLLFLTFCCAAQESALQLKLIGKDSTETKILDSLSYARDFQNYTGLVSEIDSVQKKLLVTGYIDYEYLGTEKISDSLILGNFRLNKHYKKITIYFNPELIPKQRIQLISEEVYDNSFTVLLRDTENTLETLTNYFVNQGKSFSQLSLGAIEKKRGKLFAKLTVSTGNTRTIDDIIIKGYEKFPASFLKHYTKIKKGKIFNRKKVINNSNSIDNLSFAKNSKPPEVLFEKDSTSIYLYLEKKTANTFDGFLGFSSDNETNNLELNGYIHLNLINNLNYGEELSIIYKNDGNDQQRFEASTSLPYIFKTPIGLEAGLTIFRRDSTFLITEQNINLTYSITNRTKLFAGYETTNSSNLLDTPLPNLPVEDFTSSFFRTGITYIKTQNRPLFPLKMRYALLTQFGSRKTDQETIDQIKGQIDLMYILELNRRNSLYVKNTAAAILSNSFFVNELYRFGGMNSIRGFEENTINASLYNVLNTEYRYILSNNLYIHSIIDYAYFEDESNAISDNLTSLGFGLGLQTATGIFRIIFANGKSSSQNFEFSNTKVHLSLIAQF